MAERRVHVRVPIFAQVELTKPYVIRQGHARDISTGGMRIETPDALPEGADVLVRILLPTDEHPIELPGKVVNSKPNVWIGIAFYTLTENCKQRILNYAQSALQEEVSAGRWEPPNIPPGRRSGRICRSLAAVLRWRGADGKTHQEAAGTRVLSRHGALLNLRVPLDLGTIPLLRAPDYGDALCHVVYSGASDLPGSTDVAIEFLGSEDFWRVPFPPESVTLLPSRRRSCRVEKAVSLQLVWQLPDGSEHQETLHSRDLSLHGVGLVTLAGEWPGADRIIKVHDVEAGRRAAGYIVWHENKKEGGLLRAGLALLGVEDFWGIEFQPDSDYPEPASPSERRASSLE